MTRDGGSCVIAFEIASGKARGIRQWMVMQERRKLTRGKMDVVERQGERFQ